MYTYICGQDTFRSRRSLKDLIAKLPQTTEFFYFDASADESSDAFWLNIKNYSLFGGARAGVILYPLSGKPQYATELALRWTELSASVSPCFVWEGGLSPGSGAKNFAGKNVVSAKNKSGDIVLRKNAAKILEFPLLANSELKRFIRQMAESKKLALDDNALIYLADSCRGDLWMAENELEKFALTGKLDDLGGVLGEEKIFAFTDAIILGEKAGAYRLFVAMKQAGFEELYLLGALVGVLRIMLKIKSLVAAGGDYRAYESLNLHPFVLKKNLSQARRFRMEDLKRLYRLVLESDILLKTSALDSQTIFARLISEF